MVNVFGERLKKLRKEKNYTQEHVASFLNVNRTTLIKWEKGTAEPSISHLRLLSKEFNVDISYLLGEDDFTLFLILTASIFCDAKKYAKVINGESVGKGERVEFAEWVVFWNSLLENTPLHYAEKKRIKAYQSIGYPYLARIDTEPLKFPDDYNMAILEYIINADYIDRYNKQFVLPDDIILWMKSQNRSSLYEYMYGYNT